MFAKPTILVLVAMFAAVLLSPAVSADHGTPADRCSGLIESGCSYCSHNGGFQDENDFYCNSHSYPAYTWQDCQNYVYDYCIQGALLQQ